MRLLPLVRVLQVLLVSEELSRGLGLRRGERDVARLRDPGQLPGNDLARQLGHAPGGRGIDSLELGARRGLPLREDHFVQDERARAGDARHRHDFRKDAFPLAEVGGVLEQQRVRIRPEDLLLQIGLEAAHHREHDREGPNADGDARDGNGGHHDRRRALAPLPRRKPRELRACLDPATDEDERGDDRRGRQRQRQRIRAHGGHDVLRPAHPGAGPSDLIPCARPDARGEKHARRDESQRDQDGERAAIQP